MQWHPSLYYVMYLGTLLFAVQFNVFISLLWFLFIVYYLVLWFLFIVYYLFLVMQQITNTVERSIFECNIQKKRSKIITIKKYCVIFKNRNMKLRFKIAVTDIRD